MNANLKKPCANCPFLKVGAIELREGRLDGIIADLAADDSIAFPCHKTTYHNDDDDSESSGKESMCIGAAIYSLKTGTQSVALRLAIAIGLLRFDDLVAQNDIVIDIGGKP